MIYDVIVIGAGHAGIEAASAASKIVDKVLLITMNPDTIGLMSCNPAIGGLAKGQIVREIDVLGGEMARNIDETGIQFRMLNTKKGPAVQSPRAQADKLMYSQRIRKVLEANHKIDIKMDLIKKLIIENGVCKGVIGSYNDKYLGRTVVITPGTFLKGRLHIGERVFSGGRLGEFPADGLGDFLKSEGFPVARLKTGTPARVDGKTIDFSVMEAQYGDNPAIPFSFKTEKIEREQVACYKTHTNETTHSIIEKNIKLSAVFYGNITGVGPRYCPSIEDKINRFPDKTQHQIFVEPEGLYTDEYYLNGISTSLPVEIQEEFLHTIKGLENVKVVRYAYAVEYDFVEPYVLKETLETKYVENLYFAGQINGTSGYEEAAGQGLIAGANAALKVKGKEPLTLGRDEAYIGVLIDDLITKGTNEPYRMFTSRAEYRLILRADNADIRLAKKSYDAGLIDSAFYEQIMKKYENIEKEVAKLKESNFRTDDQELKKHNGKKMYDILKMPAIDFEKLLDYNLSYKTDLDKRFWKNVEIIAKYDGYIAKAMSDIEKFKRMENMKLPLDFDYSKIEGLTIEARQKLNEVKPSSIGQASRISGVSPADITVLIFYFKHK